MPWSHGVASGVRSGSEYYELFPTCGHYDDVYVAFAMVTEPGLFKLLFNINGAKDFYLQQLCIIKHLCYIGNPYLKNTQKPLFVQV